MSSIGVLHHYPSVKLYAKGDSDEPIEYEASVFLIGSQYNIAMRRLIIRTSDFAYQILEAEKRYANRLYSDRNCEEASSISILNKWTFGEIDYTTVTE